MPVAALLAPAGYAVFRAFVGEEGAVEELTRALLWPGVIIYVVAVAVLWAGWALELE
jgi:RsiW-degrading membrane proteinase PrsW (M82 family)